MATNSVEAPLSEEQREAFALSINPPDAIDFCFLVRDHFPAVFDAIAAKVEQRRLAETEFHNQLGGTV